VFRLVVVLLFLAVAAQIAVAVSVWMDGDAVIARAGQAGAFRQGGGQRLTTAERTIAIDQFGDTWGVRAFPCRTLAIVWNDMTSTSDTINPSMPVSQRLAAGFLANRGASVRAQLRRFVVACELEQRFDDTQLLRAWLATANFGPNAIGLESAAQAVFAKHADALDADEAAKLAALLRRPSLRDQLDRWTQQAHAVSERVAAWRQ